MLTAEQLSLFLKALINQMISFRAEGIEHIPRNQGALLVCNHHDLMDGLLVGLFSGRRVVFPGRQEVKTSPVFGTIERVFREVQEHMTTELPAFDPGEELLDLMSQMLLDLGRLYSFAGHWLPTARPLAEHHDRLLEILRAGHLVAVFPGLGFSRGRDAGTFDPAVARLLIEAKVPLVPAALYGTHGLSDMTRWVSGRNRGRVVIYRIGQTISPDRLPDNTEKNTLRQWTANLEDSVEALLKTAGINPRPREDRARGTYQVPFRSQTYGEN